MTRQAAPDLLETLAIAGEAPGADGTQKEMLAPAAKLISPPPPQTTPTPVTAKPTAIGLAGLNTNPRRASDSARRRAPLRTLPSTRPLLVGALPNERSDRPNDRPTDGEGEEVALGAVLKVNSNEP